MLIWILLLVIVLASCLGAAQKKSDTEAEDIFFDYQVMGMEGNDSVSVVLKFKEFDEYGPNISIGDGPVMLDGKLVKVDSTPMTGPYYVVNRSLSSFAGKHQIQVTLPNQKKYREDFSFAPFGFRTGLGDTLKRGRLVLDFQGLSGGDVMRVLLTDTSYTGDGINRTDTIWNNRIVFSKGDLSYLENGPINMELTRESVRRVKSGTEAGGMISVSYSIFREFWLED